MRPVNLLPDRYRPRTAGSGDSKTAYIALGALALLVVAILGYVMTANQLSSRTGKIAQTRQQIAAAQAQAVTFKDYGDFAAIKASRLAAVKSLSTVRLDWERVFRELAHVLPEGVWLTGFDGQVSAGGSDSGGGTTDGLGRTLALAGCAESHKQVADVMVRLRELHVAEDVELTQTSRQREDGTTAPASGGDGSDCGRFYAFEIAVTLSVAPVDPAATGPVPASLGGGE